MKKYPIILVSLMACLLPAWGQTIQPISYKQYLDKVCSGNLEYAAEKLNVNASKADAVAARVFNDPELSVEYGNNQDHTLQMGQNIDVALSQTLSLGKRGAALHLAKSESQLTEALLTDYFRNLRADATIAYLDVLKQKQLYEVKKSSCRSLWELAQSDSIWFLKGKIMEVEAIQSKLEAGIMHNEVLQAESDLQNAYTTLSFMMGASAKDTLYCPEGILEVNEYTFSLDNLITNAVDNRSDIVAALRNTEVARRAVTVARRDKLPDVDLSLGISHNKRVRNEEAPAPPFNGITAGIALPLKFSSLNKGALNAARYRAQQAEIQYNQACLQVQTEVIQAHQQYLSQYAQVGRYKKGLLSQAKTVLDGKRYSYQRGEVPLLDYLNAQRTYDEVQAQYIETLYNYNASLVELEKAAGIWDIK